MPRIDAVIFDLDNVLYDENTYINCAFQSIAHFLASKSSYTKEAILYKLGDDLCRKGTMYPRLFNDVLADLGLSPELLNEVLARYASVNVPLNLYPNAKQVLLDLKNAGLKLALVTNGAVRVQKNKIHLLGLNVFFELVVYAREASSAEKPNPEVYRIACGKLGVAFENTICIGDNPYTDFLGAKQLGMRTARLMLGEFKSVRLSQDYEAEYKIDRLDDIKSIIQLNNRIGKRELRNNPVS